MGDLSSRQYSMIERLGESEEYWLSADGVWMTRDDRQLELFENVNEKNRVGHDRRMWAMWALLSNDDRGTPDPVRELGDHGDAGAADGNSVPGACRPDDGDADSDVGC